MAGQLDAMGAGHALRWPRPGPASAVGGHIAADDQQEPPPPQNRGDGDAPGVAEGPAGVQQPGLWVMWPDAEGDPVFTQDGRMMVLLMQAVHHSHWPRLTATSAACFGPKAEWQRSAARAHFRGPVQPQSACA